jgi:hypothetical protein
MVLQRSVHPVGMPLTERGRVLDFLGGSVVAAVEGVTGELLEASSLSKKTTIFGKGPPITPGFGSCYR